MVRLKLAALLKRRGWTAYRLAKVTGLPLTSVYRLARRDGAFGRLEAATLESLCAGLGAQPGDFIEWVPESRLRAEERRSRARKRK
jgi:DNA-binding Xre family transcriptional regulator